MSWLTLGELLAVADHKEQDGQRAGLEPEIDAPVFTI
jgi:hypothetical protein